MGFLAWLAKVFTGDIVGRAFDVIDKKIDSETDREKLKSDVLQTWLQNRVSMPWYVDFCFIGPLALYWLFVLIYSAIWCADCIYPRAWTIAELPSPLDQWAGWIILSRFGVGVVQQFTNRK